MVEVDSLEEESEEEEEEVSPTKLKVARLPNQKKNKKRSEGWFYPRKVQDSVHY